ncbi:hypothetical protein [Lacrimispora algidixylanolytica]|uniref:Glycosyltransferase RgtA/B/C/D-like domain-containing protein n=1 Tax=Lacrimispora algidixylanolytica TaxID=94868 RepID=A0A419TBI0_9FIRM|nr:hypothetical protein [Lacrimispora algidixylanolytica]RKD34839.1 hypothetical protein BET01_00285 [Lacrimispora algidixylanolytica]
MKVIKKASFIYIAVIILFVVFKILSGIVPHHLVRDNIKKSYSSFVEYPIVGLSEGEWEKSTQLDGVSEYYLLANAMSTTGENPVKEALGNYIVQGHGSSGIEIINYLKDIGTHETNLENKIYKPAYWWGIQSLMRPLLVFYSYSAAISVLQLVVLFMMIILFYLISNRIGLVEGVLFVFSMWSINIFVVTMSFFFASTFLAGMGICIYIFFDKSLDTNYGYIFLVAGMLTAYFDWLSATTIPLTLPLIVLFLLMNKKSGLSLKRGMKLGVVSSVMWVLGYSSTIIAKWILAGLAGFDVWGGALLRVGAGVSGTKVDWLPSDTVGLALASIKGNYEQLRFIVIARYSGQMNMLIILMFLVLLLAVLFRKRGTFPVYLSIIALYPVVEYIMLKGHDAIHCWFTYRSAAATVWAASLMIFYMVDLDKLRRLKL